MKVLTPQRLYWISSVLLFVAAVGCSTAGSPYSDTSRRSDERAWSEIQRLRRDRDYFTLRDRLAEGAWRQSAASQFARALVHHAFNEPGQSNLIIQGILAQAGLPDTLTADLRQIQMLNHLRLFDYPQALRVADALLADSSALDSDELKDLKNMRRIFLALADVPPQSVEILGSTRLRFEEGWMPIEINERERVYIFDTGANLSTIMRSEAEVLELNVFEAGIDVGTSTDIRVVADLGVADRLVIGEMVFRNVVFLVLDDELLSFPDFNIPGIVGFPVIEAMGEIRLGRSGELIVPRVLPVRTQGNLALTGLKPLTRVIWGTEILLCQLDTGATSTDLYERFYRRLRSRVDSMAEGRTRKTGGAGGIREMEVLVLRNVNLALGDTTVVADSLDVLTQSIVESDGDDYLDCNIGHDILDQFPALIVNFRDMAFLLR